MQTTTNYGLKTYEGTDLFNPLVVENPNAETIDTVVKAISDKAVGNATELKTGTVHALSRLNEDADRDVFTFRATSAFTAGDTFTLDGEQVSALTVAGEQLSTNCFIIGSTVLVAKRDTLLTFFVAETTAKDAEKLGGELPSYYATASALATIAGYVTALQDKVGSATLTTTAQDCSGAINELDTHLSDLDTELASKLDASKVLFTGASQITVGGGSGDIFFNVRITSNYIMQVEFNYQRGIILSVSTDNGGSWTSYWAK